MQQSSISIRRLNLGISPSVRQAKSRHDAAWRKGERELTLEDAELLEAVLYVRMPRQSTR
jgi:hypothetical protein